MTVIDWYFCPSGSTAAELALLRATVARLQEVESNYSQLVRKVGLDGGGGAYKTSRLLLGVARFIDASIYRDTFPAIRIVIFFHNDFHLGRKDT